VYANFLKELKENTELMLKDENYPEWLVDDEEMVKRWNEEKKVFKGNCSNMFFPENRIKKWLIKLPFFNKVDYRFFIFFRYVWDLSVMKMMESKIEKLTKEVQELRKFCELPRIDGKPVFLLPMPNKYPENFKDINDVVDSMAQDIPDDSKSAFIDNWQSMYIEKMSMEKEKQKISSVILFMSFMQLKSMIRRFGPLEGPEDD